ncbi:MAG: galactosyldiacylglycerol synthase [Gemmatimonadales bacterium]
MIQLRDASTGSLIGEITEDQLRLLIDELEETSTEDRDYYIDGHTVDVLEEHRADPGLVKLLRGALAGREGMGVRWTKK